MGLFDFMFGKREGEVFAQGTVGFSGPPIHLPAKVPAKHQTAADVLDYYCKKHGATYERERFGNGTVRIRVHLPSGDTLAGNGDTTLEAVTKVVAKMEAAK